MMMQVLSYVNDADSSIGSLNNHPLINKTIHAIQYHPAVVSTCWKALLFCWHNINPKTKLTVRQNLWEIGIIALQLYAVNENNNLWWFFMYN